MYILWVYILKITRKAILCLDVYQKIINDGNEFEGKKEEKILLEWTMVAFVNGIVGISLTFIGNVPFKMHFCISFKVDISLYCRRLHISSIVCKI